MALDEMADELYGLPPAAFIAARDERARALKANGDRDGAKAVAGLRKPTVAGWLANAFVRHRPADLERLLGLGEDLRRAQGGLDGDALRSLAGERQRTLAALSRQAATLAVELGQPVSAAVLDEVTATFAAALADPEAAEQVRRGRLTGSLSYAGLGGFALAPRLRVVRDPQPLPRPEPGPDVHAAERQSEQQFEQEAERRAALAAAAELVRLAEAAGQDAAAAAQIAAEQEAAARRVVDGARQAVDDARARLAEATAALHAAHEETGRAQQRARTAAAAVRSALTHQQQVEGGQA